MDLWMHTDPQLLVDQGVAVLMGLALAATCGLRAFLPLLTISVLGWTGHVELGETFAWMASPVTAVCFGTAVVAELATDKVPVLDHTLDALGTVVKPTAAALAAASMVTGFDPLLALVLGLLTGGVAAEAVHLVKAKTRLASTLVSGGLANPAVSLGEDGLAVAGVSFAVLLPVLGGLAVLLALSLAFATWAVRRQRARQQAALA